MDFNDAYKFVTSMVKDPLEAAKILQNTDTDLTGGYDPSQLTMNTYHSLLTEQNKRMTPMTEQAIRSKLARKIGFDGLDLDKVYEKDFKGKDVYDDMVDDYVADFLEQKRRKDVMNAYMPSIAEQAIAYGVVPGLADIAQYKGLKDTAEKQGEADAWAEVAKRRNDSGGAMARVASTKLGAQAKLPQAKGSLLSALIANMGDRFTASRDMARINAINGGNMPSNWYNLQNGRENRAFKTRQAALQQRGVINGDIDDSDEHVKNIVLSDELCKTLKGKLDNGTVDSEDIRNIVDETGIDLDVEEPVIDMYAKYIRNYVYQYKPEAQKVSAGIDPNQVHVGPMAQDIERVNDACIVESDEGVKQVDTGRLALMNAGAIGELAREVNDIKEALNGK